MGIRQNACLERVSQMLGRDLPIAWKNIGVMNDMVAGTKLKPIILKAISPISKTFSDLENSDKSCLGISKKHSALINIKNAIIAEEIAKVFLTLP